MLPITISLFASIYYFLLIACNFGFGSIHAHPGKTCNCKKYACVNESTFSVSAEQSKEPTLSEGLEANSDRAVE